MSSTFIHRCRLIQNFCNIYILLKKVKKGKYESEDKGEVYVSASAHFKCGIFFKGTLSGLFCFGHKNGPQKIPLKTLFPQFYSIILLKGTKSESFDEIQHFIQLFKDQSIHIFVHPFNINLTVWQRTNFKLVRVSSLNST